MTYGAIRGMLASLGDPHTCFVEPAHHRLETDTFKGDFGGIAASLVLVEAHPTLLEVFVSSPAETAGLRAGDRLLAVDGTEIAGLSLGQVALLIRGTIGSSVQLDMRHMSGEAFSVNIVRQHVDMSSLDWQLLSEQIGYVGIRLPSARTGEELARGIRELRAQDVGALVLDLRGDGGGLTGGAIDVLYRPLGHGIAYREMGRSGQEQRHALPFGEPLVDWLLVY